MACSVSGANSNVAGTRLHLLLADDRTVARALMAVPLSSLVCIISLTSFCNQILSLPSHLISLSLHALQLAFACAVSFPLLAISRSLHHSESCLDVLTFLAIPCNGVLQWHDLRNTTSTARTTPSCSVMTQRGSVVPATNFHLQY